ncbi:hypothetical protein [Corynebacterium halotolerans]|uniref:Uncharacterized protein n=1 Tax=Corynebacterium halotolerans YIM 70093 = DSM 44683 TaxID=1121362 RepID=M1NSE6_9CORY|nr:hypothetical protein [Corynebacterium halotolerans]AGF72392.1 hypothetical protein A605_06950 [Corynebacterium halotolerans YIM 70093 = DSM 44683]
MAPGAVAQQLPELPAGISVPDVDLSAPISVPAGTTTSVDLGVPLQVDYRQDGWVVVSNGTGVSVTAPGEGSAQAAVPVTYAGRTATITLVAEAAESGASAGPVESAPDGEPTGDTGDTGDTGSSAGTGTDAADRPERAQAKPVDTADAELLNFDAVIEGRDIVVKLGIFEAADLYSRFKDTSRDGLKVRYVDTDGNIIEGVERDINAAARTMTLTYPEGQTPDNPFIIQLVRDDEAAEVIVTLTAPDAERAPGAASSQAGGSSDGNYAAAEGRSAGEGGWMGMGVVTVVGAVLALVVILLLLAFRRSRRARQ